MVYLLATVGEPLRRRWPEVEAALRWIVRSWIRPSGSVARWEQERG